MRNVVRCCVLLLALMPSGAALAVTLRIITTGGFVGFEAQDNWPTVAAQSHLPVAVTAFQLPNPADEGTADSTNLAISLFDLSSVQGRQAFAARPQPTPPARAETIDGWHVVRRQAPQGSTTYTVVDATRERIADVAVAVRIAWPHLSNNPPDYAARMDAVLRAFLGSVHGQLGAYKPGDGEVIRRPEE